jgi:hypothetical protein
MRIEVILKLIYGQERFYPDNDASVTICEAMRIKTLTKSHLNTFRKKGWEVVVKYPEYKFEDKEA